MTEIAQSIIDHLALDSAHVVLHFSNGDVIDYYKALRSKHSDPKGYLRLSEGDGYPVELVNLSDVSRFEFL